MIRTAIALTLLMGTVTLGQEAQPQTRQKQGVQNTQQSIQDSLAYLNQACLSAQMQFLSQQPQQRQAQASSAVNSKGSQSFQTVYQQWERIKDKDSKFYQQGNAYLTSLKGFVISGGNSSGTRQQPASNVTQPASNPGQTSQAEAGIINGLMCKALNAQHILQSAEYSEQTKQDAQSWISECKQQLRGFMDNDNQQIKELVTNANELISSMQKAH